MKEKVKKNPGSLIGNRGYRKYLKIDTGTVKVDDNKIESSAKFDGLWVLQTNKEWSAEQVTLKYKQLWQIEYLFRDFSEGVPTGEECFANQAGFS